MTANLDLLWWAKHSSKKEICRICGKEVKVQIQKGTGLCSRSCEKIEQGHADEVVTYS